MTACIRPDVQIDRLVTVTDGSKLMVAGQDVIEDVLAVVDDLPLDH